MAYKTRYMRDLMRTATTMHPRYIEDEIIVIEDEYEELFPGETDLLVIAAVEAVEAREAEETK